MSVPLHLSIPELRRVLEVFEHHAVPGDDRISEELGEALIELGNQDIELNAQLSKEMAAVNATKYKLEQLHKKVGER